MQLTPQIKQTLDGSDTLFVPDLNEHYHSTFGAVQESRHVFIDCGLFAVDPKANPVSVFEVGFGTGLNLLLTLIAAKSNRKELHYTTVELHPLDEEIWKCLNYDKILHSTEARDWFPKLHLAPWGSPCQLDSTLHFTKIQTDLNSFTLPPEAFHLIYFDAFGPDVQPELWSLSVFENMVKGLKKDGILITYSCKGSVKRSLTEAGFTIEKLPGPPGKREILRARKK